MKMTYLEWEVDETRRPGVVPEHLFAAMAEDRHPNHVAGRVVQNDG